MTCTTAFLITGTKTGDANITETIGTITLTNTDSPIAVTEQLFSAGVFAAVTKPALAGSTTIKKVIIIPPPANSGAITLKGVTGDTGLDHSRTEASLQNLNSTTNLGLLCASDCVMKFIWG